MDSRTATYRSRHRFAGVTLVELMVALALGSFLMLGAITVFMQSRTTFRISESVARLQENARFVLDAIEPDIRMGHYFGLTTRSNKMQGRATALDPVVFAVSGDCGLNWSVNLGEEVGGTNNGYGWTCAANGGAQAGSDTLVVRRVAEDPETGLLNASTLYVQSARFQDSQLFTGSVVPAGYLAATSQTHELVVNGYYVSQTSALGNNVPSLRRKLLTGGAGGIRITDEEVLPFVEDLQIQFGVDTDPLDTANRGAIDRYVNPGDPILDPLDAAFIPTAEILAVRIWVRIRADRDERGYVDDTNYIYADQNLVIPAPLNAFRRVVVSKTIYLRNARPPA